MSEWAQERGATAECLQPSVDTVEAALCIAASGAGDLFKTDGRKADFDPPCKCSKSTWMEKHAEESSQQTAEQKGSRQKSFECPSAHISHFHSKERGGGSRLLHGAVLIFNCSNLTTQEWTRVCRFMGSLTEKLLQFRDPWDLMSFNGRNWKPSSVWGGTDWNFKKSI